MGNVLFMLADNGWLKIDTAYLICNVLFLLGDGG